MGRRATPEEEAVLAERLAEYEPVQVLHVAGRSESFEDGVESVIWQLRGPQVAGPKAGPCREMVASCNKPTLLGNAENLVYDNRSQFIPPDRYESTSREDVADGRLNWHVHTVRDYLRRVAGQQPAVPGDLPDSRLGTGPSPCVVCGSDVRVNAVFCVECAYMVPLVRRHYSTRILELGDDDA